MRKQLLLVFLVLAAASAFSGCERNDYQHPLHRSSK
jgi:predicted small secreted protein